MNSSPQCAIVMPAYNEEACIGPVCLEWLRLSGERGFLMIVVDDGSRDRTGTLLDALAREHRELRVIHQPNQGHGAAVLRGYQQALEAGAHWIFQVDSDGQFTPGDFAALFNERAHAEYLLGFRRLRRDPWLRKLLSCVNRTMMSLIFGVRLRDPNAPYRLMSAHLMRRLLPYLPPGLFAPNVFLAAMAAGAGFAVIEIPVSHRERLTGAASIGAWRALVVGVRCIAEMLQFRREVYPTFLRVERGANIDRQRLQT
jgi:glycosyltransferase involved in cell wall biosynthesis